jgi:hypothetical protein
MPGLEASPATRSPARGLLLPSPAQAALVAATSARAPPRDPLPAQLRPSPPPQGRRPHRKPAPIMAPPPARSCTVAPAAQARLARSAGLTGPPHLHSPAHTTRPSAKPRLPTSPSHLLSPASSHQCLGAKVA